MGVIGDSEFGVRVEHPLEQSRARPWTTHDEHEWVHPRAPGTSGLMPRRARGADEVDRTDGEGFRPWRADACATCMAVRNSVANAATTPTDLRSRRDAWSICRAYRSIAITKIGAVRAAGIVSPRQGHEDRRLSSLFSTLRSAQYPLSAAPVRAVEGLVDALAYMIARCARRRRTGR